MKKMDGKKGWTEQINEWKGELISKKEGLKKNGSKLMNEKEEICLYNIALSDQQICLAGHSLWLTENMNKN